MNPHAVLLVIIIGIAIVAIIHFHPRGDGDIADEASMLAWHEVVLKDEDNRKRLRGQRFSDEIELAEYETQYITQDYTEYAMIARAAKCLPVTPIRWSHLTPHERILEIGKHLGKKRR